MKISYSWLKEYIDVNLTAQDVAEKLTFCGLEVESVETFEKVKGGLKGLVVGEVITKEKHPDADKLSLTTVNIGAENLLQIVCGAPNVAAGQKVIVATVGTKLYPSHGEAFEIKKSKIRGAVSEGMICAEDEIGLGTSHDGIMILDANAVVGTSAAAYFNITSDEVFEIGLTPNRVDAASHIGVARDLAAVIAINTAQEIALKLPDSKINASIGHDSKIKIEVLDEKACPRYSGLYIENVQVADSPEWLKNKLLAIGIKPINNVVDMTNFVLMEMGQPLHAFDADEIKGNKVIVKKPAQAEKFICLDGVERTLSTDDLIICNEDVPMCIAGVYGGLHSGVSAKTKNIFLESAYFDASTVRKTSKLHNLKTDAAFRFERGTDPSATVDALKRAAQLITAIAGGQIVGDILDHYPNKIEPVLIKFNLQRCAQLIGKNIPVSQIKLILKQLGIAVINETSDDLEIKIPLNKVDVTREADVVEEVLRIYGYNNVELPDQMKIALINKPKPNVQKINQKIRNILAGLGFQEILNNSLTSSSNASKFLNIDEEAVVKLLNPLSSELDSLRQSLVFGALETVSFNSNRKNTDLKLFEIGKTYQNINNQFSEANVLSICICGSQVKESWNTNKNKEDFYRLKGVIENLCSLLGIHPSIKTDLSVAVLSDGLEYQLNNKSIAFAGKINSSLLKHYDINGEVFYAEIKLDEIYKPISQHKVTYTEVPKFPEVRRDLALLIDEKITFDQIVQIAKKSEKNLLKDINLFDVYQGKNLEAGKKSYAVSFTLQDTQATLNDKQIDKVMSKLIKAYEDELGATLRS